MVLVMMYIMCVEEDTFEACYLLVPVWTKVDIPSLLFHATASQLQKANNS